MMSADLALSAAFSSPVTGRNKFLSCGSFTHSLQYCFPYFAHYDDECWADMEKEDEGNDNEARKWPVFFPPCHKPTSDVDDHDDDDKLWPLKLCFLMTNARAGVCSEISRKNATSNSAIKEARTRI